MFEKKNLSLKIVFSFLLMWFILGFAGRSMIKYYDIQTHGSLLGEDAWLNIFERQNNQMILTGPSCYIAAILYIAMQPEPKWGMIFDFKSKKIPSWEEFMKTRKFKNKNRQRSIII